MIKDVLKNFDISLDNIKTGGPADKVLREKIREIKTLEDTKRFEIVLNQNLIDIKDRFTCIHSYMGLKLSLEPFEKDVSFIIRPTNELTYEELKKENKQLKEKINKTIRMLEIQIEVIKEQPSDNSANDNMEIKQREMVIRLLKEVSE